MKDTEYDLVIIGAGPAGLSCAIEAERAGLNYLVLEKGSVADAIRRFPANMTFFSTPELLELGSLPFSTPHVRPTRVEALEYYRRVAAHFRLKISLRNAVTSLSRQDDERFLLHTSRGERLSASFVIIATGYYDRPNLLHIPGESLPHVFHFYSEPYLYEGADVLVVGGQNSAVETALDLYRHGARVTIVHRGANFGSSVKYWVRPDIENRVKEGSIKALFHSSVSSIEKESARIRTPDGERSLTTDAVFLMTGYLPDLALGESVGLTIQENGLLPVFDPGTYETNVSRLYLAGSAACGCETGTIFIENGRKHAQPIIADILKKRST